VVLAQVTLPASPTTPIASTHIENITYRRQIYSTAVLQEQLIACCCAKPSLAAPTDLTCTTLSRSEIRLAWKDNAIDETEFRIERSPNSIDWAQIATVGANTITYTDTGLPPATTFHYRVRAYRHSDDQFSDYSNETTCTTQTTTMLPDLVPVPSPGGPPGQAGFCDKDQNGRLIVRVRNQGTAPAPQSITRVVFDDAPDQPRDVETPVIEVGTIVVLPGIELPPGVAVEFFTITVNANDDFPELNKDNNTARGRCPV
jgi:hypothetical protein